MTNSLINQFRIKYSYPKRRGKLSWILWMWYRSEKKKNKISSESKTLKHPFSYDSTLLSQLSLMQSFWHPIFLLYINKQKIWSWLHWCIWHKLLVMIYRRYILCCFILSFNIKHMTWYMNIGLDLPYRELC